MDIRNLMVHNKPRGKLFEEEKQRLINRGKVKSNMTMIKVRPIFESIDTEHNNDQGSIYHIYYL